MRNLIDNRKAISPVIATIIIVAVAIVMSIAVAYWMMGLTTTFTRYEKLEYVSAYPLKGVCNNWSWNGNASTPIPVDVFNITITLKNTGTSPASITKFFLNGIPDDVINMTSGKLLNITGDPNKPLHGLVVLYDGENIFYFGKTAVTVNPGETKMFKIMIVDGAMIGAGRAVSGVTLEIMVQTAAGYQYPKSIVLP